MRPGYGYGDPCGLSRVQLVKVAARLVLRAGSMVLCACAPRRRVHRPAPVPASGSLGLVRRVRTALN